VSLLGDEWMIDLSIQVETFLGLSWPRWKRLVAEVERLGFYGLYVCDHFGLPHTLALPSVEMTLALTYLADHSERVMFGSMVAPLSFRDPIMLARQAMALDDLSNGRMVLGVGAGWIESEHTTFGYDLGTRGTRLDRLAEGLEVITQLSRSVGPVSFDGRFYHLQDAQLGLRSPKPNGPVLMIGGAGPQRTLPLVARYADVWAPSRTPPERYRETSEQLDQLIRQAGRPTDAVRRADMDIVVCWRDEAELERRIAGARRLFPDLAELPPLDALDGLRTLVRGSLVAGTPEEVVVQLRTYEAAGLQELMIDWFDLDDIEGLQVLADEVLAQLS
jgi:alkanesulfonate monooxygenase SsuD/methylene tetrahydromethanopterin reductase-like flavin-dependent oxidoreductase (luciferase family)